MANAIYPLWKKALTQGSANCALTGSGTTGVYIAAVDTNSYTYSASHEFYASISSAVVGTPVELTNKSVSDSAIFDADDATFTAMTGNQFEALVIYIKNTGANTTWRLVHYIDVAASGLPCTPQNNDITVTFNASGIFKL